MPAVLARRVRRELLHEALGAAVEARGKRRLVGGGHEHGVHPRIVRRAQHVPAAVQVVVDELLGIGLGPIDVLVGGEVEDHIGACTAELGLEPPRVADVAEHVGHALDEHRIAATAIRREGGLVAVE